MLVCRTLVTHPPFVTAVALRFVVSMQKLKLFPPSTFELNLEFKIVDNNILDFNGILGIMVGSTSKLDHFT